MKIIYIQPKYDYSQAQVGIAHIYHNNYDSLVKMNGGQNKAIFFPIDVLLKEKGPDKMNEELGELILKEKPDLIFLGTSPSTFKKEIFDEVIKKSGAVLVTWAHDDHWSFYNYSRHIAHLYNWIFTTDPLAVGKYRKIGYKNAVFMPQCFNHFLYKPLNLPKIYDVSFIGRPHGARKKIMEELEKEGINVTCFGPGWPNGPVSTEEEIRIVSQSKINLNLTESSGVLWKQIGLIFLHRNPDRSIRINNPSKWLDNLMVLGAQKRKQIKGRIFKIVGCGGFLLTGYAERLEELYASGREIVCFSSFDDMVKKIKYYLAHDKEREEIAKAGRERSLRDHSCEKRFNDMFKIMGLSGQK